MRRVCISQHTAARRILGVYYIHVRHVSTAKPPAAAAGPIIYKSSMPSVVEQANKERTLYEFTMKRLASFDPNKVASVQAETEESYTYAQVIAATQRVSQALYHLADVRRGDVVTIALLNNAMYGPLTYGILGLGAIVSTVNAVAAPSTLAFHFKTNRCKVVLGMKYFQKALEAGALISERETGIKIKILYPEDFMKLKDKLDIPADYNGLEGATLDDTVFIPFSSGTTGLPKGVQLTNRNLIANTLQTLDAQGYSEDFVSITVLPFFHIYGFMCCLHGVLAVGATQIVMMKYTVDSYTRLTAKYRANFNLVAPPILLSLLKNHESFKDLDLSCLQSMRCAAAPLGPEVESKFKELLPHCSIGQGYGMTEMSPVVTVVPAGEFNAPSGSCGVLLPDTELRMVKVDDSQQSGLDKSAGVDCAEGEHGEIWVRGPQMFKGYLHAEETEVCMQDGWYRTGDIGRYDAKTGYLFITDRLKELIKYKGFQVSPASMEAVLLQHPWVHDCIVVGVPDPRDVSFENPRALVVLKPGLDPKDTVRAADEIYQLVVHRNPPHKRLHGGVRIVDAIPRNEAGKLLRRQIRQEETALMKAEYENGRRSDAKSPPSA